MRRLRCFRNVGLWANTEPVRGREMKASMATAEGRRRRAGGRGELLQPGSRRGKLKPGGSATGMAAQGVELRGAPHATHGSNHAWALILMLHTVCMDICKACRFGTHGRPAITKRTRHEADSHKLGGTRVHVHGDLQEERAYSRGPGVRPSMKLKHILVAMSLGYVLSV